MSPNQDGYPRPAYAWYMVILLLIIYTFSFIDRQILGLLGPAIKADFGISDTEFGLLTGFAFALFYTFFGLFCARIADSKSRRLLIAAGLFLWSLMTAASSLARSYSSLFLMRMGVGVGEAALAPAANSLLADSFPKKRLATALSVYSMGIPMGSAIAFIVGGAVIDLAESLPDVEVPGFGMMGSWQKAFLMVGIPGLLLTLMMLTVKEPIRKGATQGGKSIPVRDVIKHVKDRGRAYAGVCLGVSCVAALGFGTLSFLAFFFYRYHGMNPADVGKTFGTISLFTGPAGLLLGGFLADRWLAQGKKDAHIRALLVAPVMYLVPSLALPFIADTTVVWWVLGFSNIFINLPSGIAFAALQIITPNQMRGQVIALYVLATNIIGYGAGPLLIGAFTDHLFGDEMLLNYSLALVAAITTPLSIGLLLWGRKAFAKALTEEEARLNAD
ncbi:spinster family MFS transporter [Kordiimonas lacus]|uniref:Predicted arabinose efflux permease, MFS family n=1 Tax=Kordiimonas lacus TaxID=637679 RepID=A0A1G7E794_9PROT|nr:MFS transporter [Kordiimonas lacus]SDE59564.1 Predicted arabinose efflux permease, MFS family [Kordiimonas lacus]